MSVNNVPPTKSTPWQAWLSIIMAVVYGVSPIDLIPDLIPILGLVDDLGVGAILGSVAIAFFLRHRRNQKAVRSNAPTVIDVQPRN